MLTIGAAAEAAGVKIPTIRYYEQEGLIAPPRTESGRRLYSEADVQRLAFIRRARELGFDLGQIGALVDLAASPDQACEPAEAMAERNLAAVQARIAALLAIERALKSMLANCPGGTARDCRIIEAIGSA